MLWRFQSHHHNISHMVDWNPDGTVCEANVNIFGWIRQQCVGNFLPPNVSVWVFSGVVDMSPSLYPVCLLLWWSIANEAFRKSPSCSPHLRCPQKWCQDNGGSGVCTVSHQLWKLKETLSADFCNSPSLLSSSSPRFALCLYCLLMISKSPLESIRPCM